MLVEVVNRVKKGFSANPRNQHADVAESYKFHNAQYARCYANACVYSSLAATDPKVDAEMRSNFAAIYFQIFFVVMKQLFT